MIFGSLFSGIGGFDLGLERAGMTCAWQCEIDKAASSVLARRFPGIPNIGDVRDVKANIVDAVDLICGGFPCQDLSVAGKRAGLAGERSGLWYEFHRVLAELRPGWVVVENVPGLLSSNGGRDFAVVLRGLVELGYGVAWRILDSQYFGVPQRRRRVFIAGHLGDGRAAQVLFERDGGAWNTPPSREKGQGVAAPIGAGTGGPRGDLDNDTYIAYGGNRTSGPIDQATALNAHGGTGRIDFESETFVANWQSGAEHSAQFLWQNRQQSGEVRMQDETMPTVSRGWGTGGNNVPFVGVRRLTPTECERLQGFPDGWTDGQSDSARYRQLGNAVTVSLIEWLGRRVVEELWKKNHAT